MSRVSERRSSNGRMEQIIVDFSSKNEQLKVITLEKNQGLGEALRIGLNACLSI